MTILLDAMEAMAPATRTCILYDFVDARRCERMVFARMVFRFEPTMGASRNHSMASNSA